MQQTTPRRSRLIDAEGTSIGGGIAALQRYKLGEDLSPTDLDALTKHLVANGDAVDEPLVEQILEISLENISNDRLEHDVRWARLLMDNAFYYERVGKNRKYIDVVSLALKHFVRANDINCQRRAHNALAAAYGISGDYYQSCSHLEQALRLAREMRNPLYKFAALSNAVAVLHAVGLREQALVLAKENVNQPDGELYLDYLHFVNSNNGVLISYLLGDFESVEIFYHVATDKLTAAGPAISTVSIAYYEISCALYGLITGSVEKALTRVNQAIANLLGNNVQVEALLYSAQALLHLDLRNQALVNASKEVLSALVSRLRDLNEHREFILQTLVALYRGSESHQDVFMSRKFSRLLREHVTSVKHRHFFARQSVRTFQDLRTPAYIVPSWLMDATTINSPEKIPLSLDSRAMQSSAAGSQGHYQSNEFALAEVWAIAAEHILEGSGHHSFCVGRIARMIGADMGFNGRKCDQIELACRLHDIGKLVLLAHRAYSPLKSPSNGGYFTTRQHALAGEQLLVGSGDPTLDLAADIAGSHHEWWNGSGLPRGLRAEQIPLEGRICAVADAFVRLVFPSFGQRVWPAATALEQLQSMSGFQLDPSIVTALLRRLDNSDGAPMAHDWTDLNELTSAHSHTIESIALESCE